MLCIACSLLCSRCPVACSRLQRCGSSGHAAVTGKQRGDCVVVGVVIWLPSRWRCAVLCYAVRPCCSLVRARTCSAVQHAVQSCDSLPATAQLLCCVAACAPVLWSCVCAQELSASVCGSVAWSVYGAPVHDDPQISGRPVLRVVRCGLGVEFAAVVSAVILVLR